jgi:type I restriction enzyme S subunit
MSFPRYGEYKDSGVEWLGNVPSHWGIDRFKASIISARNGIWGDEPQGDENDIVCVRVADFDRSRIQIKPYIPTVRSVTEKERANRVLRKGDLLLEKSGGGELQPVGQVVLYQLDTPAVCSNFVARVALKPEMFPSYWNYVHSAGYFVGVNRGSINQTSGIQNLDQDRYFNERAPFPPSEEQIAIAAFLDRETAKIDALIAEQEKLITLLVEKRQAIISQAVTRGLDPDAPMKDSGVAWLGEVPAHWNVKKLRYVASVVRGASPRPAGDPEFFADDAEAGANRAWVTVAEVTKDERIYLTEVTEFLTPSGVERSQTFRTGTLVFTNSGATLGVPKILGIDCCANDGIVAFNDLRAEVDIRFLYFFLLTTTERLRTEMKQGGGQPNLNTGIVKDISFAVPPSEQQTKIVDFLLKRLRKLDTLGAEAAAVTALLKERRAALIAAAVTGQIKVFAD